MQRPLDGMEVNAPRPVVVKKAVVPHRNRFERRQIIKQRIRRSGNQNLIARIAEQAEEIAVGLAGAGGQADVLRWNARIKEVIILRDSFTSVDHAQGLRLVAKRAGSAERLEECARVIAEATGGWI